MYGVKVYKHTHQNVFYSVDNHNESTNNSNNNNNSPLLETCHELVEQLQAILNHELEWYRKNGILPVITPSTPSSSSSSSNSNTSSVRAQQIFMATQVRKLLLRANDLQSQLQKLQTSMLVGNVFTNRTTNDSKQTEGHSTTTYYSSSSSNSSSVDDSVQATTTTTTSTSSLSQLSSSITNSIMPQSTLSSGDPVDLYQFSFECRGVLLTVLHVVNECYTLFETIQKKRREDSLQTGAFAYLKRPFSSASSSLPFIGANYENKVAKRIRKLTVAVTMIEMCDIMLKDRRMRRMCDPLVTKRGYDFPFCDTLSIDDYEQVQQLDSKDFLAHAGSQFVPMMKHFFSLMVRITASHGEADKWFQNDIFHKMAFVSHNAYFLVAGDHAASKCVEYFKEVTPERGSSLWNLQDHMFIKPIMYLGLPYVHVSRSLNVPMKIEKIKQPMYCKITEKAESSDEKKLQEETDQSSIHVEKASETIFEGHDITVDNQMDEDTKEHVHLTVLNSDESPITIDITESDEYLPEGSITSEQFNHQTQLIPNLLKDQQYVHDSVQVRIILPSEEMAKVDLSQQSQQNPNGSGVSDYPWLSSIVKVCYDMKTSMFGKSEEIGQPNDDHYGSVILHIHGGGFVAMSSFSHECYVRLWARKAQIPIISVDYRHAPDHRFPTQVEECYNVYKWVVNHAHEVLFGGKPLKRVIVTGDSAGGNLTLGVTMRAIYDGIRIPDAIAVTYPAAYLSHSPSPARLMALVDPLVNMNFLTMCESSLKYQGDLLSMEEQRYNAYISPCIAPDEVFKHFPPTYMNVGSLDPLLDDAIYTARRIHSANGGRLKLDVYDGMGHGYLNLVDFVPEAREAALKLVQWILDMLDDFNAKSPTEE